MSLSPTTTLATGRWRLVAERSTARFAVRDKLVTTARGALPVTSGAVLLGPASTVESARVELDVSAIDTGNAHRDRDLAKPGLLDTATHPTVVVTASGGAPSDEGWVLDARLSARGQECPVELAVTLVGSDAEGTRVHVAGRLDRRGLGMRVPTLVIGRYVDLDVDLLLVTEG